MKRRCLLKLTAPLVALGHRSPLNFSLNPTSVKSGIHVNLFNNAWGYQLHPVVRRQLVLQIHPPRLINFP